MALNSSAIYLGQAAGAAGGGWLIAHGGYGAAALVGLAWMAVAIALSVWAAPPRAERATRMTAPAPAAPRCGSGRRSPGELFLAFNRLALQGFGGVLAVAQRELVERRRWLTREQFVEMLAISQVLPGPNIVNLSLMFGDRYFGLRGAHRRARRHARRAAGHRAGADRGLRRVRQHPVVAGALRGMGAVAAGLVHRDRR